MEPIVRRRITDDILDRIRGMILSGELRQGDRLPNQNEFAAQLGVSRPSLREALHTLNLMGAIEQRPGIGTVLRARAPALLSGTLDLPLMSDADGTLQLLETRRLIEVGMVELAVDRATDEELAHLADVLEEMSALAENGEADGYREKDLLFHHLIAQAAHNRFLLHVFMTIRQFLEQFLKESFDVIPGMLRHSQQGHKDIFKAFQNKDRKRAVKGMNRHLRLVQKAVEDFFHKKNSGSVG
jgi:GntR family transcriptional repressor for pyruvate dehydrogenase complex